MTHRALFLLFLSATASFGQSNLASISGVVTDAQGASMPGAKVTMTNVDTGVPARAVTNDAGFYATPNLAVGSYTLSVEHEGFRRYLRPVTLNTGQTLGLDVKMEIGAVSETVNVREEVPLIETRTSDVTQLIEAKSIEDLPLGNRHTLNVINLTGAAVFISYPNTPGNTTPNFSLAGGRSQSQMFWIDGGSGQNMRLGAGQINLDPPVDTVEEIKVLSNSNSAEYGGSAGGIIVETTKSGTNKVHGSLYEFLRNNAMDAPGFFAPVQNGVKIKPELRYNVFGGTVGGPIRRDKTFFFFAYEGERLRTGGTDTFTVPTQLQRGGDFSQTVNAAGKQIPIYDPSTTTTANGVTTRTQFPNNVIPSSLLDPVALKILSFYPSPSRTPDNITGANNFRGNYVGGTPADFYMVKVDHNLSERDRITGRYLQNGGTSFYTSVFPDAGADPRNSATNSQKYVYGNWTRTLNPTAVNDLRFTYIYRVFHNLSAGLGGNYPQKLGITGVPEDAFPQFLPAGFSNLGTNAQERRQYPIEQEQFVDNFSKVQGRHALKFGLEGRRSRNHEFNLPTVSGAFTFATTPTGLPGNAATGNGLASMLVGFPTNFAENQTDELDRSSWYLAAFAQDDWTISPSLTLNLGVRWETDTPIVDVRNRMNGFDPAQINPVSGTPGVVKFMGLNGFRTTPYDLDWNNFGPRFGFAWKPFGSAGTVVRGGIGIFYAHPFESGQPNTAALGFSTSAQLSTPDNGITSPFFLRNGVPSITVAAPVLNDSYGAVALGKAVNTAVSYYEPNRPTGYSQQFNLGVQHELPGQSMVEVSVLGNLGRKLPSANLPLSQILPQILGPAHQSQIDRPFPQFNGVTLIAPPLGRSNYYAGLLRFQKRYAHGLSLGGNYTFAKFLGDIDTGNNLGDNAGPYSNQYNRRADYGPVSLDIRHRFTFNAVYELPFRQRALHGWSLASVATIETGGPITITTQTNTTNSFSAGSLRANVLRDPNLPSGQRTVSQWFDTTAFAQPAQFQFGNEGMGLIRAAGLINVDFSLQRQFRFGERIRLQVRGEFINAPNHTNLGLPGHVFGAPGLGVISGLSTASAPRQIQVGARIAF